MIGPIAKIAIGLGLVVFSQLPLTDETSTTEQIEQQETEQHETEKN